MAVMNPPRVVQLQGDSLLQPSPEPLFPADLGADEQVQVIPPVPPWRPTPEEMAAANRRPHDFPLYDTRYWRLAENGRHPTDALFSWTNNPGNGQPVIGHGFGLERVPAVVEFVFKPRARTTGLPDFWQIGGAMVMSSRLLNVLLEHTSASVVHRPIVMRDPDGIVFDEDHHLVDVVRVVAAVDYANSVVTYMGPEQWRGDCIPARVVRVDQARLRDDIGPDQLFRHGHGESASHAVLVADPLRKRIDALKPKARNLRFEPLYWGF